MPLSVYEKNQVKSGASCLVQMDVTFNVINKPRTQAPNAIVPDPKPEYVIAGKNVKFVKGDENLITALKSTMYGDNKELISLRDKSPFAPAIFGKDNEKSTADKLIPDGKCLKNGQPVLVHVQTFTGYGNIGCGFDAIKLSTPLSEVQLQDAGGSVSADVFDL